MRSAIVTINQIEGFHRWPQATGTLAYLAERHRHVFFIECEFAVSHDDRDIEIISQQHQIENFIRDNYGIPAEFHDMSCEAIARHIMAFYPSCVACTVREDGMGGGKLTRRGW